LLPGYVNAADKPPSDPNKPVAIAGAKPAGYDLAISKEVFVWAGGKLEPTLGNVVDALREVYPSANLVMAPGLPTLRISDLKLRAGNLWEYLEAIRVASGAKFDWMGPGSPGPNLPPGLSAPGVDPTTGQPIPAVPTESNTGLFILREPMPTEETTRTVEAFNIGSYLQWLRDKQDPKEAQDRREQEVAKSLDELEQIVRVTLESLKQGSVVEMPSFRFHRGANLLIIVGTRNAVEVARKVVTALPQPSGSPGAETSRMGGAGLPGMSPEVTDAFRKRYGLPPAPEPTR
jgi:hypothetical protein